MDDNTRKIREALDACRPGSDDLRAPEMELLADALEGDDQLRRIYRRGQEFDSHLRTIYHDVPVPEGLEDRLLAGLAWDGDTPPESAHAESGMTAIVGAATEVAATTPGSDEASLPAVAPQSGLLYSVSPLRYAMYLGAPALAVVALVAAILVGFRPDTPELSQDELLRRTDSAVAAALESDQWNLDLAAVPSDREFPSQTLEGEPLGWQRVELQAMDNRAVAHLLSGRPGSEVILLISDCPDRLVGIKPEPSKLPASGQQTVGAWQEGGRVYVLVVRGRGHDRRYEALLRARGQMASLPSKFLRFT